MCLSENKLHIINETEEYIRSVFENEGSGHDWWHVSRVRKLALYISENEGGDTFVIEMTALLHDLDDWKLTLSENENRAEEWLSKMNAEEETSKQILQNIEEVSFKGAGVASQAKSLESKIVQDADRLDAMGAIGVARAFAYGGRKERLIYHPEIKPVFHDTFKSYQKNTSTTINHFYEKLLLLKDRLNTETAKRMAEKRYDFMESFLNQFFAEWNNIF